MPRPDRRVGRQEITGPGVLDQDDILSVLKVLIDIRNGNGTVDGAAAVSEQVADWTGTTGAHAPAGDAPGPGGTAPLPSSLLMGVVPAQVAGVTAEALFPEIVGYASVADLLAAYGDAVPVPGDRRRGKIVLSGNMPSPANPPSGCPFHPRCPDVMAVCRETFPRERDQGDQRVCCHLY